MAAWAAMPLQVRNVAFVAQPADGYGIFAPRGSAIFASTEPMHVYVELLGYTHRQTADGWRFGVIADWQVRSAAGQVLFEQREFLRQEIISLHRNTEFFINLTYNLEAPPGMYVMETTLRDIQSDQQVSFEQDIEITLGRAAAPGGPPAPGAGPSQPDYSAQPLYGTVNLNAGFLPDPHTVPVAAGGPNPATGLGPGCQGYINNAQPDVRLNFQGGSYPLNIYVSSQADTTLVVNLPNGQWRCNDDAIGLNPWVQVQPALSGQYDIWVGTYQPGANPQVQLNISEIQPQ